MDKLTHQIILHVFHQCDNFVISMIALDMFVTRIIHHPIGSVIDFLIKVMYGILLCSLE